MSNCQLLVACMTWCGALRAAFRLNLTPVITCYLNVHTLRANILLYVRMYIKRKYYYYYLFILRSHIENIYLRSQIENIYVRRADKIQLRSHAYNIHLRSQIEDLYLRSQIENFYLSIASLKLCIGEARSSISNLLVSSRISIREYLFEKPGSKMHLRNLMENATSMSLI